MSIFDTILLIILSGFVFYGLFFGLIRTVGVLVGIVIGAWIAGHYYLLVFDWLAGAFFGHTNIGKVIVFLILFSLANRLVGLGFYFFDKMFHIFSIIPFLKTINRLGGAILGFFAGTLFLGLILYVISRYTFINHWFGQWLIDSRLAPFFLKTSSLLLPLLPVTLKKLRSLI